MIRRAGIFSSESVTLKFAEPGGKKRLDKMIPEIGGKALATEKRPVLWNN